MSIARFRLVDGEMVEDPQGDYVLYDDHRAARSRRTDERLQIRYNELLAHNARMREELEKLQERAL